MNEEELKRFYQIYNKEIHRLNSQWSEYMHEKLYDPQTVADAAVYATKRKVKEQAKDPVENDEYLSGYNDGYNDAKNKYQGNDGWIKFSEKNPPLNIPVIVLVIKSELYEKVKTFKIITFHDSSIFKDNIEPIAWRYIPNYDTIIKEDN